MNKTYGITRIILQTFALIGMNHATAAEPTAPKPQPPTPQTPAVTHQSPTPSRPDPKGPEVFVPRVTDRDKQAQLEKRVFEAFAKDFAMFYACQESNTDWYLKRSFEQLKNTIAQSKDLSTLTTKPSDLFELMKKYLNADKLSETSKAYLERAASDTLIVAGELQKATLNSAKKINWNEPLGGGKGILTTAQMAPASEVWNATGSKSLFRIPKFKLRGEGVCKADNKVTFAERDRANRVFKENLTFDSTGHSPPTSTAPAILKSPPPAQVKPTTTAPLLAPAPTVKPPQFEGKPVLKATPAGPPPTAAVNQVREAVRAKIKELAAKPVNEEQKVSEAKEYGQLLRKQFADMKANASVNDLVKRQYIRELEVLCERERIKTPAAVKDFEATLKEAVKTGVQMSSLCLEVTDWMKAHPIRRGS